MKAQSDFLSNLKNYGPNIDLSNCSYLSYLLVFIIIQTNLKPFQIKESSMCLKAIGFSGASWS